MQSREEAAPGQWEAGNSGSGPKSLSLTGPATQLGRLRLVPPGDSRAESSGRHGLQGGACLWEGGRGAGLLRKGFRKAPGSSQAPRRARKRTEGGASSNVFSMFDQSQIQEFKEVGQTPHGLQEGRAWAHLGASHTVQPRPAGRLEAADELTESMNRREPDAGPRAGIGAQTSYSPHGVVPGWDTKDWRHLPGVSGRALQRKGPSGSFWEGAGHGPLAAQCPCLCQAFTIMDQNRDGFIDKEDLRDTFAALGRINVKNEELEAMVKEAPGPINFTVFLTMFGEKLKGERGPSGPGEGRETLRLFDKWDISTYCSRGSGAPWDKVVELKWARASLWSGRWAPPPEPLTPRHCPVFPACPLCLGPYLPCVWLPGTDPEETILHAFKVFDAEGKGFIKADFIKEKLMTQADRFSEEEVKQMFAAFPPDMCGNLDYRNLCYVITHGEEKD
ncbi:Myosin regulatory light chain 10 [Galemys pyrenaicus]|uniref:Myosin regulatory light chain 10 n=1 Tax=Galemys pyrenaicus TaxID=202257 RepID=A0A8J5ZXH8_GALPY|nr:Myosin regulatory light chain 10 [Galemys pyrenaicus]